VNPLDPTPQHLPAKPTKAKPGGKASPDAVLTRIPPTLEAKIISASAGGLTIREIAKALDISRSTVGRVLARGDTWAVVSRVREQIRVTVADSLATVQPLALTRVHEALAAEKVIAKDVDALSRAALNLEKIGASVSGENRQPVVAPGKVEVTINLPEWAAPLPIEGQVLDAEPAALVLPENAS